MNNKVKSYIDKSVLCWLATCHDNIPNVSPKEIFTLDKNDNLLIANIASPNSVKNILSNKHVCVSFIDIFIQKGYKITGTADIIHSHDESFLEEVIPLKKMVESKFKIHSIIKIKPINITPIIAPNYLFHPDTDEESQITNAMNTYHVKPA